MKRRVKQATKPQRPVSLSGLPGLAVQDDGAGPRGASSETALNHLPSPSTPYQRPGRKVSPSSEGLGSSCLSSCCSSDKLRKRRMRGHRASVSRRDDQHEASQSSEPLSDADGDKSVDTPAINPTVFVDAALINSGVSSSNSSPRSAHSDVEQVAHADETSNFSEQAWDNYLVSCSCYVGRRRVSSTILWFCRTVTQVRRTAKIRSTQNVPGGCWSSAKITATTWTACRTVRRV